jgi:lipopolysaccharide heptosyltransferase I
MMRILIIKLSSIGDVIHTLPSLYALRKTLAGAGVRAEIDWLVEEAASSILTAHPMINNLIIVKNRGWITSRVANIKTAMYLRSRRYDMVLDFQGLMKSGIWVLLSRGRRRIGFSNARELSRIFLNDKVAPIGPEMHAVERYLQLARHAIGRTAACKTVAGKKDPNAAVEFPMPDMDLPVEHIKKLLKKHGLGAGGDGQKSRGFFAMVPHARWPTKLWGDEAFIEFARNAIARYGMDAVLTGGPMDRAALDSMRTHIGPRAANLAGETDLTELAALFSQADFVVTVDSGPMHIAAAVGTPVIALFGPTSPERTGPYGKKYGISGRDGISGGHTIITHRLDCSPCFKKKCPEPVCMTGITVEEVLAAAGRYAGAERAKDKSKKVPC